MKTKFITITSIIFLVISSSLFISSCEKDEIEPIVQSVEVTQDSEGQVSKRTQTLDIIFYRGSFTTDNYLIGGQRTYLIFNKSKVKDVAFSATSRPSINVAGVTMKHYNVKVTFKDLSIVEFTAFSKTSVNSFTITPTGNNLLTDTHSAKYLELTQVGSGNGYVYHYWRDTQIAPKTWNIRKDAGTVVSTQVIEPIDKNSNIFMPTHIH